MDVLAISPESERAGEAALVPRLLEAGLSRYHLRKPGWDAERLAALIGELPAGVRGAVSLHGHRDLVARYGLGGCHEPDGPGALSAGAARASCGAATVSRSLHRIEDLAADSDGWDYVLLSPVFRSIGKPGYGPAWSEEALRGALAGRMASARVYALGGVDVAKVRRALALGFDGVALHGALWHAADPVAVLREIGRAAA